MYIENRCRPRAATVEIRKRYFPVERFVPFQGTVNAGAATGVRKLFFYGNTAFPSVTKEKGWYSFI